MKVEKYNREDWSKLSAEAHLAVFGEFRPASVERIDFALLVTDGSDPVAYMTIREIDSATLYLQYGGSFRPGSISSFRGYSLMLNRLKELGYKRATTYIENTNTAMLKFAMKMGWLITGIRNFDGIVLTEQTIKFESLNKE